LPRPTTPVARETVTTPHLVVVTSPEESELLPLLRAELKDLGLEVVEHQPGNEPMEQLGGVVACRIIVNPGSIEVSILEPSSGRVTLREIFSQSDNTPVEARTAVLHVVELLRWHLQGRSPSSRATPPGPTTAKLAPPPSHARWLLSFIPLALYSPGGTKPGLGANLDLAWMGDDVGIRATASTLLVPNRLSATEGTAKLTPSLFGAELVLPLIDNPRGLSANAALGLSLVTLRLRGTTKQAYQTQDDDLLTAAPLLELRATYALSNTLSATLAGTGLVPLRSDAIYFAERHVGTYGKTLFTLGLGLEAKLN
jgi:hypothetical protein